MFVLAIRSSLLTIVVEYGEFVHQPGRQYANFLDIRKEIEADTDRVTGKNKGISSKPINLKIYSPKGDDCYKSISSFAVKRAHCMITLWICMFICVQCLTSP
jgi:hypothetical protein